MRVISARYLGVVFDEHLKWKLHIDTVILRLRKCFHIFEELRNILDLPCLRMIYFALVQSILLYGIIVWGSAYQNVLELLNITHRILVRIMMKNDFIDQYGNTAELFKKLKL